MGEVVALAIDPTNSRTLIVASVNNGRSAVFTSKDAGQTWEKQHDLNSAPKKLWIDPNSNSNERDVYAAGKNGVAVRLQGKWSDRPAPHGVTFSDASIGFSKNGAMIYATSESGVHLSSDGGKSW